MKMMFDVSRVTSDVKRELYEGVVVPTVPYEVDSWGMRIMRDRS